MNVPYSEDHQPARTMDVFAPDRPNGAAVLLVHGGGWSGGEKAQWHSTALYLSGKGYACASAGYRLAPATKFPAQIEDVRLAMSFFRGLAKRKGFTATKVAAMGSSAGGHLVALLATIGPDDKLGWTEEVTAADTRPNAVIAYCPATDLHQNRPGGFLPDAVLNFLGQSESEAPELYRQASPVDRVTGAECPFLFVHGDQDPTIPHTFSVGMGEKLRAAGAQAEVVTLPGVGHGFGYGVTQDVQKTAIGHVERFLGLMFKDEAQAGSGDKPT
jgi:acetyl esterase/lipase